MLNRISIMGRLTRDPELRHTQSQTPVASFTLAVDRDFSSGSEKQTDFIDCVAWRNTAEFVSKYFRKGSMAVASGRLQIRDWTDRDGGKRRSAEVLVDSIYFGESKRENSQQQSTAYGGYAPSSTPAAAAPAQAQYPQYPQTTFQELEGDDGDLPF